MKLLFDQNLSHQLKKKLKELFPVAENVQAMGLRNWLEFLQSL